MNVFLILCVTSFLAGLIDAVVGGGGLINLPVLFSVYPNGTPATLLGTNKLASVWGTATAAFNYSRVVKLNWPVALAAAATAFIFSFVGAYTVTQISPQLLRKALPFVLILLAVYIFRRKQLGQVHSPVYSGTTELGLAVVTGIGIGFYDGFFGPGTGSFLIFIFVRLFGFDFLNASAVSKIVNVATNLAALLLFGIQGNLLWKVGFMMALFGVAGSLLGARLAIERGSKFVRQLFLVVVLLLIIKTCYDAFLR